MIGVGLDLGNSKISCIVYDINSKDKVELLSLISRPTNSIKKSLIDNTAKVKAEVEGTKLRKLLNELHSDEEQ